MDSSLMYYKPWSPLRSPFGYGDVGEESEYIEADSLWSEISSLLTV